MNLLMNNLMEIIPVKTPLWLSFLYPNRIWKKQKTQPTIYLTFDDGPIPEITPWVLKQLELVNAKATFFCIGANIKKNPSIFSEIIASGHQVGNHTFQHLNGWKTSTSKYIEDVLLAEEIISTYSNKNNPKFFRPPYGKLKNNQAKALMNKGYQLIMWDVLTKDYDANFDEEKCLKASIKATENGSIVLFHDSLKAHRNLSYVLPRFLKHFSEKGYVFESLP
ncbi:MAG: polysaccharide deacetylase family protein [Bacteroidota bacterium]